MRRWFGGADVGSLWLMDRGTEGDHKGKSGSSCSGPEKERMRMWIQAEAIGWEEEERKKTGGGTVKTCHQKWELRDWVG